MLKLAAGIAGGWRKEKKVSCKKSVKRGLELNDMHEIIRDCEVKR